MAATPRQMEIMISFVDEHPQLANNYVAKSVQGRQAITMLWTTLANKLNACGLPNKSTAAWRKVWTDCKYRAKKKCSQNLLSLQKTGGGPSEEVPLSPMEEKVASLASLREVVAGSSSQCFGARQMSAPEHDDITAATSAADDDFLLCFSLSESDESHSGNVNKRYASERTSASTPKQIKEVGSTLKRNRPTTSHERIAPTPKRRNATRQNEGVEVLQKQFENDKCFQNNLLAVLTERNQQESSFQGKVIKLLERRNEIAEKQLELETKKFNLQ